MDGEQFVIIDADDFGLSAGVNRGIARAHEDGSDVPSKLAMRYSPIQRQ